MPFLCAKDHIRSKKMDYITNSNLLTLMYWIFLRKPNHIWHWNIEMWIRIYDLTMVAADDLVPYHDQAITYLCVWTAPCILWKNCLKIHVRMFCYIIGKFETLTCIKGCWERVNFDGLGQYYSNSNALAMELLQSCTKPLIWTPYNLDSLNCGETQLAVIFDKALMCWDWLITALNNSFCMINGDKFSNQVWINVVITLFNYVQQHTTL